MRVRADRTADLADANPLARLRQPLLGALEFVVHERQLQSKGDWFRVHAVTSANHRGHFEPARLLRDHRAQCLEIIEENFARLCQLNREGRV